MSMTHGTGARADIMPYTTREQRLARQEVTWGTRILRELLDHVINGRIDEAIYIVNGELGSDIPFVEWVAERPLTKAERVAYVHCPEHLTNPEIMEAVAYGRHLESIRASVRTFCRLVRTREIANAMMGGTQVKLARADTIARIRAYEDNVRAIVRKSEVTPQKGNR
jgi:hypothetical protein